MKYLIFFSEFNSKSETFIYSRLITRKVKYLKRFFCFNLYDYGLQLMEIKNPVSQNIRTFHKINQKRFTIQKCPTSEKYVHLISTQYLVGAPLARITASIRRGMEATSLSHC